MYNNIIIYLYKGMLPIHPCSIHCHSFYWKRAISVIIFLLKLYFYFSKHRIILPAISWIASEKYNN